MKRIVYILCVFIFFNGCTTKKLQLSIEAAKTETILLEYNDALYKDEKLYLGFVTSKNNLKINCVAEYDLSKNNQYYGSIEKPMPKPVIIENTYINKNDEGIKVPITFIDKKYIPISLLHPTDYESFLHNTDLRELGLKRERPSIYVAYEEVKDIDGAIYKKINNSMFLFSWMCRYGHRDLEISAPAIDAPNRIKEYSLKSLYPFALLADLPVVIVLIPYAIVYKATVIILGVDGLDWSIVSNLL